MAIYSTRVIDPQPLPQETIHAICSSCYGKMPNLREPVPLVFPYCNRVICCYCRELTAYEGIFYKDEPRTPCHCRGLAARLGDMSRQYSAQIAQAIAGGVYVPEPFVLLDDDRGRGGHLYSVRNIGMELEKWLKAVEAQGHHVYTGYPNKEP